MSESSKSSLFERFVPVLLLVSVALAFMVGVLWQKVSNLEKGGTTNVAGTGTNNNAGTIAEPAPEGKLTEEQAKKVPAISDSDHLRGSKDADVILIEYSDLECPFCEKFHPTAKKALDEYGGKVAWVYRQFPLISIHPRALPAANAAECVASIAGNDAFWKFTDTVFSDQTKYLTDDGLSQAAVSAGAKKEDYESCVKEKKYEGNVTSQSSLGEQAGITGTPGTFVINKKGEAWLVSGAVPYETLKATIDEALSSK